MTGENAAPAEMPGVEEIGKIIRHAMASLNAPAHVLDRITSHEAAQRVLALFAPILAEKERAELVLCDLMNAAGHYKATHSEIDREALSATIKAAADHFAAAIRAEGE